MMFSVVIPLYNKEHTIERAIRSVLSQTVQDFEIIVVDDGSTDHGPQRASRIADQRIRMIHQANQGVSAARNRGIAEARAEFVAFLDADDYWEPNFLYIIDRLICRYPHCAVFATRYRMQYPTGELKLATYRGISYDFEGVLDDYFGVAAKSNPPIFSSAVCIRREALIDIGGFPSGVASGEDLLTWARLLCLYRCAYSMEAASVFSIGAEHYDYRRVRMPDPDDQVGNVLRQLLQQHAHVPQIRKYLAFWARTRLSTCLRGGMRYRALCEFVKAVKYDPCHLRVWKYLPLFVIPSSSVVWITRMLRR